MLRRVRRSLCTARVPRLEDRTERLEVHLSRGDALLGEVGLPGVSMIRFDDLATIRCAVLDSTMDVVALHSVHYQPTSSRQTLSAPEPGPCPAKVRAEKV
jgi:hypothetical protein